MDNTFGKSFSKARQLHGVSLSSFIASISLSVVIFLLEVILFLTIRTRFPDIYKNAPSYTRNTNTSWKEHVTTEFLRFDCQIDHFDRYFFRRYLRSLLLIFIPASILITPILVALNYTNGKNAGNGVSGLDTLGWSNIGLDQADRYWAHLVFSSLFTAHVCWIIWNELTFYVAARQRSPSITLRTVLIDSIPDDWMSEKTLASQLQLFPGEITSISFNRDYSAISKLAAKRKRLAKALETAETANMRKACRAGVEKRSKRSRFSKVSRCMGYQLQKVMDILTWLRHEKVDTRMFYREEIRKTGEKMQVYRTKRDEFPLLRSAFITFSSPLTAQIVCQTVIHTNTGYMTPRLLPLSIDDVIWSNVNISWIDRTVRTVLSNVLIGVTATACVVPVALAGLLSQIVYMSQALSWLSWINELPESILGLLQGVLPPILVAILVRTFVTVLDYLVRKQGIPIRSHVDLKIQDYYFYFLFVQVTLVVSLSAGLTAIANEIASGAPLAATLAKNLPKASNYFISYILLQGLSISANSLLRIDCLLGKLVLSPIFDKSVTQMMIRRKDQDVQWGTFVPIFTNLSCIGLFYPKALKHLLVGLYLMQAYLIALFLLVRDSQGKARCIGQACVMLITTGLTAVYHHLLRRAFDPLLTFSPTALEFPLAEDALSPAPFLHKALTSAPIIRIPSDDCGISSTRVSQLREELKDVTITNTDATITKSGKMRLR
ncbi:hypothetical protein J3E71DRAFT_178613 [Bipolaris maydis]|nr:hypothetical protein J3E71DRAFT_178613 [Bipolaris maydis]